MTVRNTIDRILRLKAEQDDLAADIRDIYAEAKSNGLDKTALGQVIAILRKKAKDPNAFEERSATVDQYLTEYEQPSRAHARAREAESATPTKGEGDAKSDDLHCSYDSYDPNLTLDAGENPERGATPRVPQKANGVTSPGEQRAPTLPAFLDRRASRLAPERREEAA